jgi:hypothetical protein
LTQLRLRGLFLPKLPWDGSTATDVLQLWEAGEELDFAWFGLRI